MEYPGEILTDVELLTIQKNALVGMGWLMQTVLGTSTVVTGLAAAQTGTPSLSITVAPGAVYSLITTDTNAYGSLGTDLTQIVKQGLVTASTTLTFPSPSTTGQSVTHLVQVGYSDLDTNNQVLSYYNSANPAVPFTGPSSTGAAQPTTRKGVCVVSVVQGTSATTGSQTTPSATTGFVGLYTVTLAFGQTTITTGQITTVTGAPFIPYTLPAIGSNILFKSNNLSDLASLTTALTNLGFVNSFGTSGYQKLPGGFIIQWNTFGAIAAGGSIFVTFPIAFPNAIFGVLGSPTGVTQGTFEVCSMSLTGFQPGEGGASHNISGGFYLAIGR